MLSYGIVLIDPRRHGNKIAIVEQKYNYNIRTIRVLAQRGQRYALLNELRRYVSSDWRKVQKAVGYLPWPARGHLEYAIQTLESERTKFINITTKHNMRGVTWSIPKGRAIMNETDLEAAIRETKEETGINPSEYRVLWPEPISVRYADHYDNIYHLKLFVAIMTSDICIDKLLWLPEVKSIKWVDMNDLGHYLPVDYGKELCGTLKNYVSEVCVR